MTVRDSSQFADALISHAYPRRLAKSVDVLGDINAGVVQHPGVASRHRPRKE